jgi:hypothetical protein
MSPNIAAFAARIASHVESHTPGWVGGIDDNKHQHSIDVESKT